MLICWCCWFGVLLLSEHCTSICGFIHSAPFKWSFTFVYMGPCLRNLWLQRVILGSGSQRSSAVLLNWLVRSPLAGRETRVMEVIKIPWEHVDACLFFRPGCEGGELPGRYAVIWTRKDSGQSTREKEDLDGRRQRWKTDEGRVEKGVKQRMEGWRKSGSGWRRVIKGRMKSMRERRGRGRHPLLDTKQRVGQMNVEVSVSRTGRGLEMGGFTQAGGERQVEKGRNAGI